MEVSVGGGGPSSRGGRAAARDLSLWIGSPLAREDYSFDMQT